MKFRKFGVLEFLFEFWLLTKRFLKRATNKDLLIVFSHELATVDFEISKPNPHCVLLSDVGQILFFDQHRITNHYVG